MAIYKKLAGATKRYGKDTAGAMAMAWGVTLAGLTFSIGASYDLTQVSKARAIAQVAADNMALAASVAVDFNNDDRFVEGQHYDYTHLGGPDEDFTHSMVGSVVYDIVDDQDADNEELSDGAKKRLLARATVTGTYTPAFMSIAPWIDGIEFQAVSDVAYAEREGTPASVFFVADNSGSMGWTDDNGIVKITSLENSMKNFMRTLEILDNDGVDDTFRTALYPYSADPDNRRSGIDTDGLVPGHVVDPEWGTISNYKITRMYDRSGTDSSGALQAAADTFALENEIHLDMNPDYFDDNTIDEPLKFLVFMTDGANNKTTECHTEEVWVENQTAQYWWKYKRNGRIKYKYSRPRNWWNWNYVEPVSDGTGYYEEREVCTYDYHFDVRSLEACDQMKEAGVLIYAIAYDVADEQKDHAEEFMQNCSSGDNFFKSAGDASALQQAFEEIGDAVITEVIRVKR